MADIKYAVELIEQTASGHVDKVLMEKVKTKSRNFVRDHSPKVEYIGFVGHTKDDCIEAMKSRLDDKKAELKINEMRGFYSTSTREDAQKVEKGLIEYSQKNHSKINKNERDGGGGRVGEHDTHYYVYGAYRV